MILNGSPRKGNTAALIAAFTEGARAAGNTVTRFDLRTMTIHPCRGCMAGGKDPKSPCTQKDDMDQIYPVYRECDVVVFASPLYFWTISGQLKCALDRMYALEESDGRPRKEAALLMAAEGDAFEAATDFYDFLIQKLKWKDLGKVLASGARTLHSVRENPEQMSAARKLGKTIGDE